MPLLSEISTSDLNLGPQRKSASGIPTTPVLHQKERNVEIQLDGEVTCLFPPSSFNNGPRLSIVFCIDEEQAKQIEAIEQACGSMCGSS
jgi:hypothetical protein